MTIHQMMEDPLFIEWATSAAPQKIEAMERFLAENEHLRKRVETARTILLAAKGDRTSVPSEQEKEADFSLLLQRIAAPAASAPTLPIETSEKLAPQKTRIRSLWPRIAAVASVLLLISCLFVLLLPEEREIYATGSGEILEILLSDGTQVSLNANSSMALPEGGWGEEVRTVDLEGEAFFSVTKQSDKRAFVVRTRDTDVRVLGTRFNVRERRGSTRIYLEEGAVRVGWKDEDRPATDLHPGEVVLLPAAGQQPILKPVTSVALHTSWRSGNLVFDHYPLTEALAEISDLYGVEISIADPSLKDKKLTTTGVPVDNLEVALQLLETALDLRIEAENDNSYSVLGAE